MTDQELIELLDQRSVEQWSGEQLALLRQRVRCSPSVRQAFVARLRLEEALQQTLARPPYTTAALSAGVMALMSQGTSGFAVRAAAWWWGTLGTTALVLTVAVGTWKLRTQDAVRSPAPSMVHRPALPLVAPEPSDAQNALPLEPVVLSPSDEMPSGFARHWDPEASEESSGIPWSLPVGSLPLVAPGPERSGF